jgi:hypothetical protein
MQAGEVALMQRSDQERIGEVKSSAALKLRKGRLASVVNARDRIIRESVLQQGHLASESPIFSIAIQPT